MSKTPRMNDTPRLTRLLVERRAFADDPFFLVDIGASGGIDPYWYEFGDQLEALGFDPLIAEVERLNSQAKVREHYVAAWVTSPDEEHFEDDVATRSLTDMGALIPRTSALRAAEITALDYAKLHFNAGAKVKLAQGSIVVDQYLSDSDAARVDFLKVDTDGHDFQVLLGCRSTLGSGRVLGLAIEVQFHGAARENANTFSNIDRYLRGMGFSLFDLEVYRYSRAALPAPFVYDIPAQTVSGQIFWGDAIYFRDLGDPAYETTWSFEPTREDILKLACLFEIFGMPDCAAEVVLKYDRYFEEVGRASSLDLLASEQAGEQTTYAQAMRRFERDARRRFGAPPEASVRS